MEVRPTPNYTITVSQKDYNLLCACIAQCAGVKGVSVKPAEASDLNVRLLKSVEHWILEQQRYLESRIAKATENLNELTTSE